MRRRTLLCYHYLLGCWLPPMTGFEYASLPGSGPVTGMSAATWATSGGGSISSSPGADGVPQGTFSLGTVQSASLTTVTIQPGPDIPELYTEGSGLSGMPVAVFSPAGLWQWRRIASNNATTITLDTLNGAPWSVVPQPGWPILVGGIEWYWYTPYYDVDVPEMKKRGAWLTMQMRTAVPSHVLLVDVYVNENPAPDAPAVLSVGRDGAVVGIGHLGHGGVGRRRAHGAQAACDPELLHHPVPLRELLPAPAD